MEIIFVCNGDSRDASTWSNVPYLMSDTLECKGHIVHRVNIKPPRVLHGLWQVFIKRGILNILYPGNCYDFNRSRIFKWMVDLKIFFAGMKYRFSDCFIFCGDFDFYNKWSKIPSILFSDWSYKTYIEKRLRREPYSIEKRVYRQQGKAINKAKAVVSMFPICAKDLKNQYPQANIVHLGKNVINNMYKHRNILKSINGIKIEHAPIGGGNLLILR